MTSQPNIHLESKIYNSLDIPGSRNFHQWAAAAIDAPVEIGVRIVDSAEGRQFNRRYRRIDKATNVLSFPFASSIGEEQNYLGDILMTAPIIVQEARALNKPVLFHWAHLFIHALLHLQGYQHNNDAEARKMKAQESKIMKVLGFSDPWFCSNS